MGDGGMIPRAGEPSHPGSVNGQLPKPLDRNEVIKEVDSYLKGTNNPNLRIGAVHDKGAYFEVDIVTKDKSLVDKLKVDKKTGQMGSNY
jgi:hypothetical protein